MSNWLKFLTCSVSLVLILKPTQTSQACGFDPYYTYINNSFFDPQLSLQDELRALFFSLDRFYDDDWGQDTFVKGHNLREWVAHHKGKGPSPSLEDMAKVVYEYPIGPLEDMKPWLEGREGEAPADSFQQNTVIQFWKKNRWGMEACYLDFAKRCEPYAGYVSPWSDEGRDTSGTADLIAEGTFKYEMSGDDPFVKMRYAYQVIRLAHYAGAYQQAVELFDALVPPIQDKTESQLYYWALGHKAGALRSLGQEAEAAYLFSQVFKHCPAKRRSALLSFRVQDDVTWDALMQKCQNDQEKITLYFIRSIDAEAQVLPEMQDIAALNPEAPELDLLLAREINKLEYDLFDWEFDFQFPLELDPSRRDQQRANRYLDQLGQFVDQFSVKGDAERKAYWKMSGAYLDFMSGEVNAASQVFAQLARKGATDHIRQHAALYQWVCQLSNLKGLPKATEDRLYKQWEAFDFGEDPHHLKDKSKEALTKVFAEQYRQKGQEAKAMLTRFDLSYLRSNINLELVEELLAWEASAQAEGGSSYEEALLEKLEENGVGARIIIEEMLATMLMKDLQWTEALKVYERLPSDQLEKLTYFKIPEDPFLAVNTDCISCFEDWMDADEAHYQYDRRTLARRLVQLNLQLEDQPIRASEINFQLGTAIYNTSYFGHSWMATGYYRAYMSPADDADEIQVAYQASAMERSLAYFEQALAEAPNLEFAAKCHYMAAKCEQNIFYLGGYSDWEADDLAIKPKYRSHFRELVNNYRNTQYYQEVLAECGYLDVYAWIQGVRD
ncbi:MAG: hypothetical protein AAF399_06880 [Bacteroidota bacterium]